MVTISRGDAISLFTALGSKTADKWGRKQMTEKIHKIDEMIDAETVIPPDIEPVLNSMLTAIEDGEEIVVTKERIEPEPIDPISDEPETSVKTYSVYVHPESSSVFVALDNSVDDGLTHAVEKGLSKEEAEKMREIVEKKYLPKNTKKEKESEGPVEDQEETDPPKNVRIPKPEGIRVVKSRSYYAGVVIRKHGISAGITEAMVNELDKMYKKRNRQESMYRLRLAWHAIYGFCGLEAN